MDAKVESPMRLSEFKNQRLKNTSHDTKRNVEDLKSALKSFIPLAKKILKLEKLPKIKFLKSVPKDHQPTFGRFINKTHTIYLAIENRQPVDILRTLAHELVHYKQWLTDQLGKNSGVTGSPIENEAHVLAGIVMRVFNKKYPEHLKKEPFDIDENFADGRNPQDKGDSQRHGIPKNATINQLKKIRSSKTASPRKKQLAHWQINMRQGRKKK